MSTKADETFQESVQALANWITFLEGKRGVYRRQLERASAAQAPEGERVEQEDVVETLAAIEDVDPEMAAWDQDDAELDSWDQVESEDAEEATVEPYADEEMGAWEFDLDDDLDTWGDENEASEETKEPEEPDVSDAQGASVIDASGPMAHLSEPDQEPFGQDANLPSGQGVDGESDHPGGAVDDETVQGAPDASPPGEQRAPGDGFPNGSDDLMPGGQEAHGDEAGVDDTPAWM